MLALGAIAGPPISGAIADSTGDYKGVGIFAGKIIPFLRYLRFYSLMICVGYKGISILASVVVMWASRCLALGRFWGTF